MKWQMGRIIQFDGARHRDLQELLPWFVTGRLDAEEQVRVQAHVSGCADCQAEVEFQRRLGSELTRLPMDADNGWSRMKQKIEAAEGSPLRLQAASLGRKVSSGAGWTPWLGWAVAASVLVAVIVARTPDAGTGRYHALGAAPPPAGNVLVMFKPEITEKELRETLRAGGARVVDGPTAAGAYVLLTSPADRQAVLASMRASGKVIAAEPIDPAAAP